MKAGQCPGRYVGSALGILGAVIASNLFGMSNDVSLPGRLC